MMGPGHVLLVLAALAAGQPAPAPAGPIEIWLLTDRPDGSVALGLDLGAAEMDRTTRLLGRQFRARVVPLEPSRAPEELPRVRQQLLDGADGRSRFVILDLPGPGACGAADAVEDVTGVVVVLARPQDACARRWLQLRVPEAARAGLARRAAARGARVDEWHHSLFRFGAEQLNDRFERRAMRSMDGGAWAGWFAAKVAAEAALRLQEPSYEHLAGGAVAFDGHKGRPLRFNANGELQQPTYLIGPDDVVFEEIAPQAGSGAGR